MGQPGEATGNTDTRQHREQKNNRRTAALSQRSGDQGSRWWQREDWRGGAVVKAVAEVIMNLLVEYRRADAKRIKFNLDKNLKNDCKRMLNKI